MATSKSRTPRRDTPRNATAGSTHPKRSESERIAEHIADFERSGGRVEKLSHGAAGVPVLKRDLAKHKPRPGARKSQGKLW